MGKNSKKSWTRIYDWILRTNHLNPNEKTIYLLIIANSWGFKSNKYNKDVTYRDFGKQLNMNERLVSRTCKSLRKYKLIDYVQNNGGKIRFKLNIDNFMQCPFMTSPMSKNDKPHVNNDIPDVNKVQDTPREKEIYKEILKQTSKENIYEFDLFKKTWLFSESGDEDIKLRQKENLAVHTQEAFNSIDMNCKKKVILSLHEYLNYWSEDEQINKRYHMVTSSIYIRETRWISWYLKYVERFKRLHEKFNNKGDNHDNV